jgi:predicted PurR-regulated permease PerM
MDRARASLLILLAILLALFWIAPDVPLLGMAAVLLAIALRLPAEWIAARTGVRRWAAVIGLIAALALLLGLGGWMAIGPLQDQANQLAQDLPQSFQSLRDRLSGSAVGDWIAERLRPEAVAQGAQGSMQSAASLASGTLSLFGNAVLVLLMGIYFAIQPHVYLRGLRALLHPGLDHQVLDALAECGEVLRGFLLGQGFSMIVTGLLTWLGLMLLGVPLAGVLGVITALLGFIPYLGPVIAAVPAVLLALTESPSLALWVVGLFVVIQTIEGNILTPLVQSRAADVPPVLLLLVQILAGALFGLLGIALAAPAAAVGLVLVRRAYVEGWLGRRVPADGEGEEPDEPEAEASPASAEPRVRQDSAA